MNKEITHLLSMVHQNLHTLGDLFTRVPDDEDIKNAPDGYEFISRTIRETRVAMEVMIELFTDGPDEIELDEREEADEYVKVIRELATDLETAQKIEGKEVLPVIADIGKKLVESLDFMKRTIH